MEVKEGDVVKLKNGKTTKVYSIGLAIGNMFSDLVNLNDGTFCFKDDIVAIISSSDEKQ